MPCPANRHQPVHFTLVRQEGKLTDCLTSSPTLNHFLDVIKLSRAYHTWVNYAHDLKIFFDVIPKAPEAIDRRDCLAFMKHQQQAGLSDATINRRLAAISSLFHELQLLDATGSLRNPIQPRLDGRSRPQRSQSLYRRQAKRLPDTIADDHLRIMFEILPTWRDRTLMLLMWISCLRLGEAVAIRFEDIECSRRIIRIPATKGGQSRVVFMDRFTFEALSRYLDKERGDLFPEVEIVFLALKGKARGRPLTANAVQKLIRYYARKGGLPHLHPHLFRHTGITQLVQHHMPEPAIRKLVGHRRPESLLPYLHLGDDFVAAEFERAQATLNSAGRLQLPSPRGVP